MARTSWAVASRQRKKKALKQAKGYRGARRLQIVKAKETLMRAKAYRTRDRKVKKREARSLWIIRLGAAARARGLRYSELIAAVRAANIRVNRQQLAALALQDPAAFDQLLAQAVPPGRKALPAA